MNIGITGASGFIGSYLLKYLTGNKNYTIHALSRGMTCPLPLEQDQIIWKKGDICSRQTCEEFIKDLDVLIHLAHTNIPLNSNNDLPFDALLNLIPTLNLLEAIRKYRRGIHIIYTSSGGAVYGPSTDRKPFREMDKCLPLSSYGIQKLMAEYYLRLWAGKSFLSTTVLRIGNPYGILLPYERRQGLIGIALNQVIKKQPVYIFGNPDNVRDYIHLEDLCRLIEKSFVKYKPFEIFNVGSGQGYSVNEVLSLLETYSGRKIEKKIITIENDTDLTDWVVLDITKAREELSWEPEITIEHGLQLLWRDLEC
ncbi:MAG TPA: NAD-dependent epimerase/dehydratase family protein [Candidatus Eremiobacteraeota bacterium]|nr:MAG: dTDP-4-dehydro-6-deoxyglucose reductase [bacterium ADurb.Bin363]HPZ08747.1 NAD-dependent epimerase/dehydratase family protein [Candidatus Eremiobacteraeota bacterium]